MSSPTGIRAAFAAKIVAGIEPAFRKIGAINGLLDMFKPPKGTNDVDAWLDTQKALHEFYVARRLATLAEARLEKAKKTLSIMKLIPEINDVLSSGVHLFHTGELLSLVCTARAPAVRLDQTVFENALAKAGVKLDTINAAAEAAEVANKQALSWSAVPRED